MRVSRSGIKIGILIEGVILLVSLVSVSCQRRRCVCRLCGRRWVCDHNSCKKVECDKSVLSCASFVWASLH